MTVGPLTSFSSTLARNSKKHLVASRTSKVELAVLASFRGPVPIGEFAELENATRQLVMPSPGTSFRERLAASRLTTASQSMTVAGERRHRGWNCPRRLL